MRFAESADYLCVVLLTCAAFGWDQPGMETAVARRFQAGSIGAIGYHDSNFRRKAPCLDGVGDGLKIRAEPGEQNSQFFRGSHALSVCDLAIAPDDAANEIAFFAAFFDQRFHSFEFLCR